MCIRIVHAQHCNRPAIKNQSHPIITVDRPSLTTVVVVVVVVVVHNATHRNDRTLKSDVVVTTLTLGLRVSTNRYLYII